MQSVDIVRVRSTADAMETARHANIREREYLARELYNLSKDYIEFRDDLLPFIVSRLEKVTAKAKQNYQDFLVFGEEN